MLRVASLNAWGGRLHAPLIGYLATLDADVLCLQEVVDTPGVPADWLEYRDGATVLPQRANLFEEIAAALPGHDGRFFPAAAGELFDGETPVRSVFGLATFVRRGFSVTSEADGFVHGAFAPENWGDHPRPRNAHVLRLELLESGPLTIAQMHGLRDLAGKMDTPQRLAQAEALVALIEQVWRPGERLLVCGDFNVLPGSETFGVLGRLGLADLVVGRGFEGTRTSHYAKGGRHADYMLVTPNIDVARFDVVAAPEVSDHRPLVIDIA